MFSFLKHIPNLTTQAMLRQTCCTLCQKTFHVPRQKFTYGCNPISFSVQLFYLTKMNPLLLLAFSGPNATSPPSDQVSTKHAIQQSYNCEIFNSSFIQHHLVENDKKCQQTHINIMAFCKKKLGIKNRHEGMI